MAKKIRSNLTGMTYNGITVTKELGGGRVEGVCRRYRHVCEYDKYALRDGKYKSCKVCKHLEKINKVNASNKNKLRAQDIIAGSVHGSLLVLEKKRNNQLLVICKLCKTKTEMSVEQFCKAGVECQSCSLSVRANVSNHVGEIVNGLLVTQRKSDNEYACRCIKCGYTDIRTASQLFSTKKTTCKYCTSEKYLDDEVGRVYNGLLVYDETTKSLTSDEIYAKVRATAESDIGLHGIEKLFNSKVLKVKCRHCRKEMKVLKGSVVSNSVVCQNCASIKFRFHCPNCATPFYLKRDIHANPMVYHCENCGVGINTISVLRKSDLQDTVDSLMNRYKIPKYNEYKVYSDIALTDKVAYRGRDNKDYYDGVCLRHNKKVLLRKDEVENYSHEQCEHGFNI